MAALETVRADSPKQSFALSRSLKTQESTLTSQSAASISPTASRHIAPRKDSSPGVSRMKLSASSPTISTAASRICGNDVSLKRPPWVEHWWKSATTDNDALHPYLRHYFDRRGVEASYRTRPEIDETSPVYQYRTPRHVGFRYKAVIAPVNSIAGNADDPLDISNRCSGNIQWKDRCRIFGTEPKPALSPKTKIQWVSDHHIMESDDNTMFNPVFRHYFDKIGAESSFRNRGRVSGRPMPDMHKKRPCTAP